MADETGKWPTRNYLPSGGYPDNLGGAPRLTSTGFNQSISAIPHAIGRDGRYRVQSRIAETDSSYLYDAWDAFRNRRVAIKQMRMPIGDPDEVRDALIRFEDSAEAGNHPNIVKILKFLELDGDCYIVMEFLEGGSLAERIERIPEEPLRVTDIHAVMSDLLLALEHSHTMDLVHRDVKPANVLLSASGQWKLTDFGIARFRTSTRTQYGTFIGTPAYASPEQVMGRPVDPRTDLYSCGVVLYELLTGHRPFRGSPDTVKRRIVQAEPVPPSTLGRLSTPVLDDIVARAMAKDPDQRFESAAAFRAALGDALTQVPVIQTPRRPFDDPEQADYAPVFTGSERGLSQSGLRGLSGGRLAAVLETKRDWSRMFGPIAVAIFLVGAVALGWRLIPGSAPKRTHLAAAPSSVAPVAAKPPITQPAPTVPAPVAVMPAPPVQAAPTVQPSPSVANMSADNRAAPPVAVTNDRRPDAGANGGPAAPADTVPDESTQYVRPLPNGANATGSPEQNEAARSAMQEQKNGREASAGSGWRQRVANLPKVPAPSPDDFTLPDDAPKPQSLAAAPIARPIPKGQQVGLLCQPASPDLVSASRVPVSGVPLLVVTGAAVGLPAQRAGIREGDILEKAGPVSKPGDFGWGSCLISPNAGDRAADVRAWRDGNWRNFVVQLH